MYPVDTFQVKLPDSHKAIMSDVEVGNEWLLRGLRKTQHNLSLCLQHLNSSQASVDERLSESFVIKE